MEVRLYRDISLIEPAAWDALSGAGDPFVEHAFLCTLEESKSVGGRSGWAPLHVTVWDGDLLVGALPLYEKDHSYGEYIFDWAWADAAMRLGIEYYPKLVSMIPLTPATGKRLLVHLTADSADVVSHLVAGALEAARQTGSSSVHFNFLTKEERDVLAAHPKLVARLTTQFHWHNDGYASFDDFLARFRAPARKQIKRERRRVVESGLEVRVATGDELDDKDWVALHRFYRDTCAKKGSFPYLTNRFFDLMPERLAHRVVAVLAYDKGEPVAGTLNFEKGAHLYGRYWGCDADYDMLHFELCYYRPIERAIERKLARFEAGAQGSHKLKRGLLPSGIHSVHYLDNPVLARAVAEHLPREAFSVARQMEELTRNGPFHREHEDDALCADGSQGTR